MTEFYRATEAEPSEHDLLTIFKASSRDQWLFDEETSVFTFKENMSIFVAPDNFGSFRLMYGYMEIATVSESELQRHLLPVANPPDDTPYSYG